MHLKSFYIDIHSSSTTLYVHHGYTIAPIKGAANATKDASPTPTTILQHSRLQKSTDTAHPATAVAQTDRPIPINLNDFEYLADSANMGDDTSKPTIKAAGSNPSWNRVRPNSRDSPSAFTPLLEIAPVQILGEALRYACIFVNIGQSTFPRYKQPPSINNQFPTSIEIHENVQGTEYPEKRSWIHWNSP